MKKSSLFSIITFIFSLLFISTLVMNAQGVTTECVNCSEGGLQIYSHNASVDYNNSMVYIPIDNLPDTSIDGFNIRNLRIEYVHVVYYAQTETNLASLHVKVEYLKNFFPMITSENDMVSRNVPGVPDFQHDWLTVDSLESGVNQFVIVMNITTTDVIAKDWYLGILCSVRVCYEVYDTSSIGLMNDLMLIIPIFAILFLAPFFIGKTFGKSGFILSLILMSIIGAISGLYSVFYGIIIILCEIIIAVIIYQKEKGNFKNE